MHVINLADHVADELARASLAPQRRVWRLIALALSSLTALAAVLVLLLRLPPWPLWLLVGLTLLAVAGLLYSQGRYRRNSTRRGQLQAGLRGQHELVRTLSGLDDSYYLVNNLNLPGRADDIDHLLVGPNGVFALETKNHRGRIYCRDGLWFQSKTSAGGRHQPEREIRDPTRQLKRNVDYLRSCINHTDPLLSRRTHLWIEGIVVFTHPAVDLDLPEAAREGQPFPVLYAHELPTHIADHVPRRYLSHGEVSHLVSMFGHLQPPDEQTNRRPDHYS